MRDPESKFVSAPDGLSLHYCEYNDSLCAGPPIVCLPGLTRNTDDFDAIARRLAFGAAKPRRVICIDYRGRGKSAWARDWKEYDLGVEHADIVAMLIAADVHDAIFLGTSRGGLHIMVLAAAKPTLLRGAILNDIGPIVESLGLIRIKNAIANATAPQDWAQAQARLRQLYSAQFTALTDEDWAAWAQMTFMEKDGRLQQRYDPALAKTLEGVGVDMAPIDVWPQFLALGETPTLALRGANSDILTEKTFVEMQLRAKDCRGFTVEGQGHAPLLRDEATQKRIELFVQEIEAR